MKIDNNIIAHRGMFDNKKIPENSLKSFQKALDKNIPIELDVQLTSDNQLVVFHDKTLDRMTNHQGVIQEKTYEEIKDYYLLDTKEKIPTLEEVLKLVKGRVLLDIEVKDTKRKKETCTLLLKILEGYSNYIIKSFNPVIVKTIKKMNKDIEVGLLIPKRYDCNYFFNLFLKSRLILLYAKPDFIAIHKSLFSKKKYLKYSKKHPIMLWTIKNKDDIKDDNNYIYICNNLPFDNE